MTERVKSGVQCRRCHQGPPHKHEGDTRVGCAVIEPQRLVSQIGRVHLVARFVACEFLLMCRAMSGKEPFPSHPWQNSHDETGRSAEDDADNDPMARKVSGRNVTAVVNFIILGLREQGGWTGAVRNIAARRNAKQSPEAMKITRARPRPSSSPSEVKSAR